MAKKMNKKQLKEVQSLATKIVLTSGVKKRVPAVPAHNVHKKTRGEAVKEAYGILFNKKKEQKPKSKDRQTKLKFK